jgi:hypothetical protein
MSGVMGGMRDSAPMKAASIVRVSQKSIAPLGLKLGHREHREAQSFTEKLSPASVALCASLCFSVQQQHSHQVGAENCNSQLEAKT